MGAPMAVDADLESIATLLAQVRNGAVDARERLMVRYRALLKQCSTAPSARSSVVWTRSSVSVRRRARGSQGERPTSASLRYRTPCREESPLAYAFFGSVSPRRG